jgi:hypothetical protein
MSQYFDQISLAAVANLSAGLISVNGGLIDLILSLILVRIGLKIFYNANLKPQSEIQLFVISAIAWLVGHSLLKGHDWDPPEVFIDNPKTMEVVTEQEHIVSVVANAFLSLLRKMI